MEFITKPIEFIKREFSELKNFLQGKTVEDAAAEIQQELDLLDSTKLNIAITGMSGAGKSSLINALRGVYDYDEQNAAEIGVTQTTMDPAQYPHPDFPNVVFWDLPGIGTLDFKPDEYLKRVNFRLYDFFIIVSKDRFTVHDASLACEIQKMGKNFYFVRTHVDVSLNAESRRPDFSEEAALEKIRNYCYKNLKEVGEPSAKVFLLSSWYLDRYDFPLLQEALRNDLDGIQEQVLIMAMPAFSKEDLKKKNNAMNALISKLAFVSCVVGTVPIPGVSFAFGLTILKRGMELFCHVFSLAAKCLERLAMRIGQSVAELMSAVKKCTFVKDIGITFEFIIDRIQSSSLCSFTTALELVLDFIPIIGSVSGAGLSFVTTYYMLKSFLDDVMEDAVSVCEKVKDLSKRSLN